MPQSLKRRSRPRRRHGLKPKAVIPVDLFGLAGRSRCDRRRSPRPRTCSCSTMPRKASARPTRAASSARFAPATATSFFPAKPLGCYGDGGAVLTDDARIGRTPEEPARARAGHRQIRQRPYRHDRAPRHHPGRGADREAEDFPRRDRRARPHRAALSAGAWPMSRSCRRCPTASPRSGRNTRIRLKPGQRDAFAAALKAKGIPTAIYYPKPLHRQEAYKQYPVGRRRHAGDRPAGRRGHQPADARLSRRADAGSHHRCGARSPRPLNARSIGQTVSPEDIAAKRPYLYHLTDLVSAAAYYGTAYSRRWLLSLFEVSCKPTALRSHAASFRTECQCTASPSTGTAVITDNLPLSETALTVMSGRRSLLAI